MKFETINNVLIDSEQLSNIMIRDIWWMVILSYLAFWNSFASYFYDQVRPEAVQAQY